MVTCVYMYTCCNIDVPNAWDAAAATAAIAWLTDALIKGQCAPTITIRKAVNAFALLGQVCNQPLAQFSSSTTLTLSRHACVKHKENSKIKEISRSFVHD